MKKFLALLLLMLGVSYTCAATPALSDNPLDPRCKQWVDSVYSSMTLEQRVGQLVFPNLVPNRGKVSRDAIKTMVQKYHVGGILFSHGTLEQYAEMINYAQSLAKTPLMITLDGEWGLAMRIKDTPNFPHNMALGAIADTSLIYMYGKEVARECRALGIHVNFAPVTDVNSNPANPVIGYRAFGEDPKRVAAAVVAYSRGLEDGNVISTAKHFPGHGDTDLDSHKALPTVDHTADVLQQVDLLPFSEYIGAGCSGIMVGHLAVPALDPTNTPASLSRIITTDLLKNKMGFSGLVFTDALGMAGADVDAAHNNCIQALRAGADVLLSPRSPADDIHAIVRAVRNGSLPDSIIETSCKKILAYKYRLGLTSLDSGHSSLDTVNSPEAETINRLLSAASITVLKNDGDILPLGRLDKTSIAVVTIGKEADGGNTFAEICSRYAHVDTYHVNGSGLSASTLAAIKKHDVIIAAVHSDQAWARTALASLTPTPRSLTASPNASNASVADRSTLNSQLIDVFMLNPYKMARFAKSIEAADAVVLAYDDTPYTCSYAAQALFGGIDVTGTLPVNLEGIAPMGTGIKLKKSRLGFGTPTMAGLNEAITDSVTAICTDAIKAGAFPGCRLLIAKDGVVAVDMAFGNTAHDDNNPVDLHTVYDLASVSKTLGTLPGVMKAYDLGLMELDTPVKDIIPGFTDPAKAGITVRDLLYHESAMPPSLNMFTLMMDSTTYTAPLIRPARDDNHTIMIQKGAWGAQSARLRRDITSPVATPEFPIETAKGIFVGQATLDTIMQRIYNIPLRKTNAYCYSCLNFCLLMDLEQHLTGIPHDKWVSDSIYAPLGASAVCYRPTSRHPLKNIAATEHDKYLRRQTLRGYVHDELADFSGGVQGNAGLFSDAYDMAKICQMWLNGGQYGDARILSPETVKLFTTQKSPRSRRGLGFDKPDTTNPDNSPTFEGAPGRVFGHTGFTGTIFWVDPEENIIFIFLCNRVNPTRDNAAFSSMNIRPALFEQVYKNLKQ